MRSCGCDFSSAGDLRRMCQSCASAAYSSYRAEQAAIRMEAAVAKMEHINADVTVLVGRAAIENIDNVDPFELRDLLRSIINRGKP